MLPSLATASAVCTIEWLVFGSDAKLSSTQFSVAALPPGARARGYTSSGPLLGRSAHTTSDRDTACASTCSAAATRHATDVAHACAMCGPLMTGMPRRDAIHGTA